MEKRVLLIIDVQKDFCPGGSLAVEAGDRVVPVINSLAPRFPLVVATRDWHPSGHVSFASSHPGKGPFDTIPGGERSRTLWPDHCIAASTGADFHPDLDLSPVNLIVHKGTRPDLDSYSAFFENDRTTPTGLESYLKGLEVEEVYLTGLALDVCVYYSALDAAEHGFTTWVITDGCRGVNVPAGRTEEALRAMRNTGIRLITSGEINL